MKRRIVRENLGNYYCFYVIIQLRFTRGYLHLLICFCLWELELVCLLWHFLPNHFSNIIIKTLLLLYLPISSGNAHLFSSTLEIILNLLWIADSSSFLSTLEDKGEGNHFVFFPSSETSFFFSVFVLSNELSTPLGIDWTALLSSQLFFCLMALVNQLFYLVSHLLSLPLYFPSENPSSELETDHRF